MTVSSSSSSFPAFAVVAAVLLLGVHAASSAASATAAEGSAISIPTGTAAASPTTPTPCCLSVAGNSTLRVWGPTPSRFLPIPEYENVEAIAYTSGLHSSVFANTSAGPSGYMYRPEDKKDYVWAGDHCISLPDAQSTVGYCTGPGQFWDDFQRTITLPGGTAHHYAASTKKDVYNMIGGFSKESSWIYYDVVVDAASHPPPHAFDLPEPCKHAAEASPALARRLLQLHPVARLHHL